MCGRYYIDDETARQIERLVADIDREMNHRKTGDIRPSEQALVLKGSGNVEPTIMPELMGWGFPGYSGKGLLINARAESVLEKRSFQDSVLHRRCIIPAGGFYEWSPRREKYWFKRPGEILFMAGCYRRFEEGDRFVVLTTAANPSVLGVHDRMPLLLERTEIESWVLDDGAVKWLLHKRPGALEKRTEYEQLRLF